MFTSDIVIHCIGWSHQSPKPHETHCFKWEFCVRSVWFWFLRLFQECYPGIKWDLPVEYFIISAFIFRPVPLQVTSQASIFFSYYLCFCALNVVSLYQKLHVPFNCSFSLFAWTFRWAFSTTKLKSIGHKSFFFKNILNRDCIGQVFSYLEFAVGLF